MINNAFSHRYRRRLLITAAAGSAGAVAAYYWYSYSGYVPRGFNHCNKGKHKTYMRNPHFVKPRSNEAASAADVRTSTAQDTSIAAAANTAAEDAQLQAHFEEMQSICSTTRIPTMVPLLMQHIERAADVDAIIHLLQYVMG